MGRDFEFREEHELHADVETVWRAISTGPGLDGWYLGSTSVEPALGGDVVTRMGPVSMESTVIAWDPPHHFAFRGGQDPEGRFQAYEFIVEGRDRGSTVLRLVASGFLPGDDWEDELEAMTGGSELFFASLVTYVNHFAGRAGTPVTASGPRVTDWEAAFSVLQERIGLPLTPTPGDVAAVDDPTRGWVDAVVFFSSWHALALRSTDTLYRFVRGFHSGGLIALHNEYDGSVDSENASRSWTDWLQRLES